MFKSVRLLVLIVGLVILAGCSQYSTGGNPEFQDVDDTVVVRSLQYLDDNTAGPEYLVSFEVPEEWVGTFETRTRGNSLVFQYVEDEDDTTGSPVFYIDALSNAQYWEQIGSYPGQYTNIKNTADTYFVYHAPRDAYYSGLDEEEFAALYATIPDVVRTFDYLRRD